LNKYRKEFAYNQKFIIYANHISITRGIFGLILMLLLPFPFQTHLKCKIWTHEFIRVSTNYKSCMNRNSMTCQNCDHVYYFWS